MLPEPSQTAQRHLPRACLKNRGPLSCKGVNVRLKQNDALEVHVMDVLKVLTLAFVHEERDSQQL